MSVKVLKGCETTEGILQLMNCHGKYVVREYDDCGELCEEYEDLHEAQSRYKQLKRIHS
jgi:hypothetical protein